ncbi:hypothetical protein ACLB5K_001784 [Enterobacter hormaechei]|nr:hypothetical protein [Enterobacter hormaechei]
MNKLFRFALIFASSFCETAWAGIVGVVFSAMTGHSEVISVLAKRTCSLLEMPTWGVGGSNPLVPTKNTLKTSLLRLVFSCLFFVRGMSGEKLGKNTVKKSGSTS